ncbi:pyridoxal kinase [Stappia indica]|uniref:pyridoxal kinase n=1 Tax=Stappia indica TaxID=538381 RepID=A0A857C977_9HYPH|nr:pyridoxal kinase [Stappia indica]QGZ35062.1 pyridoxal kinase [Stappia indica]
MTKLMPAAADARDVLVINSQVVRGSVGGRVTLFALERLGHQVWFLPTILLPWNPDEGRGHRHVQDDAGFAALADNLIGADLLPRIGAVVSGYLGSPSQAAAVARLVAAVRKANPRALYLCDPISGDDGDLYVPQETAAAVRDTLLPLADVATPNLFELQWMSGRRIESEADTIAAARALGPQRVLVTSAPAMRRNSTCNLLVTPRATIAAEHGLVPNAPHGTGDLMAATFTAGLLAGLDDETALKRSAGTVFEMVARSVKRHARDLLLADEQSSLINPMALVSCRRVLDAPLRA